MQVKVIFNGLKGAKEEIVQIAINILDSIIENVSNALDLSALEYVQVTEDFGSELSEFQAAHGLRIGYTKEDICQAEAKTVSYKSNNSIRTVIFLSELLIAGLFGEEAQYFAHIIHHELGHVHDDIKKAKIFGAGYEFGTIWEISSILIAHSDVMWSEYISTFLSGSSIPKKFDFNIPLLSNLIADLQNKTRTDIDNYRWSMIQLDDLFGNIQSYTSLVLKVASSVYAYCSYLRKAGVGNNVLNEVNKNIEKALEGTVLSEIWVAFTSQLDLLARSYPSWKNEKVYSGLGNTILHLWNKLGIYPRNIKDGIYIDVPL